MGANLLILFAATALAQLPPSPQSTPIDQQSDSSEYDDHPGPGVGYERLSDALAYDRVQGLSMGVGYRLPLNSLTTLFATMRYGLSDERITGRLSLTGLSGRVQYALAAYDDVVPVGPFTAGRSLGNSMNALFAGHDNGDYLLALGGSAAALIEVAPALELALEGRIERQRSVSRAAESEINDFLGGTGRFPPNPSVAEGTFARFAASLTGLGRTRWQMAVDLLTGDGKTIPRIYGQLRRRLGPHQVLRVNVKAGTGTRPSSPQTLFRLGGLATIRGFEYGAALGQSFWVAQADLVPFRGRVQPVAFIDAGQAAEPGRLFSSTALVGAGAGLSLFKGLIRLEFSHPVSPDTKARVRFDLVIQGSQ